MSVLLGDLTWPEIAVLREAGEELVVLPIGAVEQHGPHLPCATDAILAEAICAAASDRTGVPVAPVLPVSSSHAHSTRWPGTFSLPPRLCVEVVVELARWVRASGFTRLLLLNAHGGNTGPLKVALDEIRIAGELQVGLVHWFQITPSVQAAVEADCVDWHANAAETSLMLHLRPDLVRVDELRDDPDRTVGRVFSYRVDQTSAEGHTGAPTTATAAAGAALFDEIVTALAAIVTAARGEEPPVLPLPAGAEHA